MIPCWEIALVSAADLIARWHRRAIVCWYRMSDQTDFCRDSSKSTLSGDFQPSDQGDQLTFSVSFTGDQRFGAWRRSGFRSTKLSATITCPDFSGKLDKENHCFMTHKSVIQRVEISISCRR